MSFFSKIFGGNERVVLKMQPQVDRINELEKEFAVLSSEDLKHKTDSFRERLKKEESLDDLLPEAFAACREAAKRTIGQRHFDVQLIGGSVLHHGKIAEMKTGEGKTLSATLAVYLNAISGEGVHVVTVNDYLSKRDANWMGPVYHALGLTTACIVHDKAYVFDPRGETDQNEVTVEMRNLKEVSRREAYAADITYGTNNEFGFDYLRDNMAIELSDMVQRGHNFAIVDEVDSILIDEARTPLIISAPDSESTKLYGTFAGIVPQLKEGVDYNIDHKMRAVTLTEEGINKVEKILGMDIYSEGSIKYVHHLEQALRAHALFKRDKDYVVREGEVVIVDDFTGRLMLGRRYSEGLHQAIEAKEGVKVQQESRTLATITFQNYFRMYKKLAGMTGTAATSAEEFVKVYNLEVVEVPTNKPMIREDMPDQVYKSERGKFQAVIREIKEKNEKGQPVLVGTVSIEKNEVLGILLKKEGIPHELLNAKNHEQEAKIIAKAGAKGAVTVATNMAGRGVDIKLEEGVTELGGLHIIGTERHEARRIDDQLRGRAGRQGDPGSSRFFVSVEDELMRIFGSDRIKKMMEFLKVPEDQPIENKMISKAIESAQAKIEGFNFDIRKHVLDYDDVMNKQRETIYRMRRELLGEGIDYRGKILEMVEKEIKGLVVFNTAGDPFEWNFDEIYNGANFMFPLPLDAREKLKEFKIPEEIENYLLGAAKNAYEIKENEISQESMRQIEKIVLLRTIDNLWMDHLDNMDHLRDSVRLRAYGQKDPLVEYKNEGHRLFYDLLAAINASVAKTIYKVTIAKEKSEYRRPNHYHLAQNATYSAPQKTAAAPAPAPKKDEPGRNDPCPCGSGKKYKRCHGK